MEKEWINKNNNSSCILFFNGWGLGLNAVKHLKSKDYDICVIQNYDDNNILDESDFVYDNIYVVAWSLGVCVADVFLSNTSLSICKSIAINGTPYGMHDVWGISENIFCLTMKTWNQRNSLKFNMRMSGGMSEYKILKDYFTSRQVDEQRIELDKLYSFISKRKNSSLSSLCLWNKVYVSSNDLIIPSINQISYWKENAKIEKINSGHYPFHRFESWSEIIG